METLTMNIDQWVSGAEPFLAERSAETWRQDFVNSALDAGLPSRKSEHWKYTRIKPLFDKGLELVVDHPAPLGHPSLPGGESSAVETPPLERGGGRRPEGSIKLEGYQIITQNGHFISSDDLPTGVTVLNISEADKPASEFKSDAITALAAATYSSGIFIQIEANTSLDKPIILVEKSNLEAGQTCSIRHRFEIGSGAKGQVIEHHSATADSAGLINRITEMEVAENANFNHHQIQDLGQLNVVHSIEAHQAKTSVFSTSVYTFSGSLVRNNLVISVDGEHAETNLNGLHITQGSEHVDNHTRVDHRVPNCNSNEVYRGVLGGKSTGVFNGKVFVHQDAQITNAYQSNRNILVSDSAVMNSKPELEIYADDVKCSHGCTIGQMDKEALFYLRSRGLSTEASINLLLHAFAGEVLEAISNVQLRTWIEERIAEKMTTIND
ncbi:MAG: Fe-S cluster assembly protein SufD [Granulosicoccus sp.]|jgi:Fe-S cluster assembly protein SufD